MSDRSGVSRGDRNRNARLARLRAAVPLCNAIAGIDLADARQMVVITDHESRVLARRAFQRRASLYLGQCRTPSSDAAGTGRPLAAGVATRLATVMNDLPDQLPGLAAPRVGVQPAVRRPADGDVMQGGGVCAHCSRPSRRRGGPPGESSGSAVRGNVRRVRTPGRARAVRRRGESG